MTFHPIDGYLLDSRPDKASAIAAALATRSTDPRALPFYRAFEAVGVQSADEALLALRLVLAGRNPEDLAVRRLRGLVGMVRAGDAAHVAAVLKKDGAVLTDLGVQTEDPTALGLAARAAYTAELTSS